MGERAFVTPQEAADQAPDIPFRYVYVEVIDDRSSDSFGQSLSKRLNDLARLGAEVVSISTSFHVGAPLRVAQIVAKMDANRLGSTYGVYPDS